MVVIILFLEDAFDPFIEIVSLCAFIWPYYKEVNVWGCFEFELYFLSFFIFFAQLAYFEQMGLCWLL